MHKSISFKSKGLDCSAFLYIPEKTRPEEMAPAIIMAHGLSGVKEQALPHVAEKFSAAGFVTLVFDYRFHGDSEGEPRNQIFPLEMAEDYRNAITWISELPQVDPHRIGIWGTSLSGSLVLYVGTSDRRVKAVVAQVPALFNPTLRYARNPEKRDTDGDTISQNPIERYRSGDMNYINIVAPPGQTCVLPGKEAYDFFISTQVTAPNWRNQMTMESMGKIREFDSVSSAHLLSPTPIMFIPAENDGLVSPDVLNSVYGQISEPKALVSLPVTHFEIYRDPWLSRATDLAIDWYKQHL